MGASEQRKQWTIGVLVVLIPSALYVVHALMFGHWIIDDAGISFAYARNLAHGHGLVAQPGSSPVEGYSNFLWVLVLAPFFYLNLFHPVFVPKLLGAVLVISSFTVLYRTWANISPNGRVVTLFALCLTAENTSFVAWTTSGLENPLYLFLICLLMFLAFQSVTAGGMTSRFACMIALTASGVAITRPDGCLYFGVYPVLVVGRWLYDHRSTGRNEIRHLATYALVFFAVFGSYLVFKLLYFDDILPNTFYAKVGASIADAVPNLKSLLFDFLIVKPLGLATAVAGPYSSPVRPAPYVLAVYLLVAIATASATLYLIAGKRFSTAHAVLALFTFWSALVYVLLPGDWFEEYRFATPFIVLFYGYISFVIEGVLAGVIAHRYARIATEILIIALVGVWMAYLFTIRTPSFASNPPVPFSAVAKELGRRFDNYAAKLGVKAPSVLLPDMGASLYYSKTRLYDLGGLCDKTIAKTLGKNSRAFHDYVFEKTKPTFIHTHGLWALRAEFDRDSRFRRDYLPISEAKDAWVKKQTGRDMYSGDYVRKDALTNRDLLRHLHREPGDPIR